MKLTRVHIQNYRSIVDSGPVEIDENVTVIIGKNEQGKTNLLKAVRAFNVDEKFSPSDLPNHLRPTLEDRAGSDIPIVKLWFTLEPQDKKKLVGTIESSESVAELVCVKNYDNSYRFWVRKVDSASQVRIFL